MILVDIDLSNPKTDVVDLYFKFKELFWTASAQHSSKIFTRIHLEVFIEGFKNIESEIFLTLNEEDLKNIDSLIFIWLKLGFIRRISEIGISNYECVR